jgi:hypothetical protein
LDFATTCAVGITTDAASAAQDSRARNKPGAKRKDTNSYQARSFEQGAGRLDCARFDISVRADLAGYFAFI